MLLPTYPSFGVNDSSLTKLQQLAGCVAFASVAANFPMWHYYRPSTQAISSASTWTTVNMTTVAYDTDSTWTTGGIATIATQGYYVTEACVGAETQTSIYNFKACFLWTAGTGNPHYTSGTTKRYAVRSGSALGAINVDETLSPAGMCPVVAYPGDTIAVQAWADSTCTLDFNSGSGPNTGRCVTNFTGRMVRQGS